MEAVEVDGSYGEGGGQILRTAAALSIALHKPIHVTKIRAGRKVPGLRQQHVAVLEILRAVCGGTLQGCNVRSSEIAFSPGTGGGGPLFFDLMTAASITLVLQAVVPAISLSGGELTLELVGGTDVPWSPTFDYFGTVVRHAFSKIGVNFEAKASTRGYYPRGGGRVKVSVERCTAPRELVMVDPGGRPTVSVLSRCGSLPEHVARRQLDSAVARLGSLGVPVGETSFSIEQSNSPGSSLLVYDLTEGRMAGSDAIGERGKSAERVGAEAAESFASFVTSGACVDPNLADMLVPVLAIAERESRFRIPRPTSHLETNLHLARLFTGCEFRVDVDGPSSILTMTPRTRR